MAETVQTFDNIPAGAAWDEAQNAIVHDGKVIQVTGITSKAEFDKKLEEQNAN